MDVDNLANQTSALYKVEGSEQIKQNPTKVEQEALQAAKLSESTSRDSNRLAPEVVNDKVINEVDKLNQLLETSRSSIRFKLDEGSDRVVISVVDQKSGEVIRNIPSEETLKLSKRITEYLEASQQGGSLEQVQQIKGMILEQEA